MARSLRIRLVRNFPIRCMPRHTPGIPERHSSMKKQVKKSTRTARIAFFVLLGAVAVLAVSGFGSDAQELIRFREKKDQGDRPNHLRSSIELAGYTRPGTPPDTVND